MRQRIDFHGPSPAQGETGGRFSRMTISIRKCFLRFVDRHPVGIGAQDAQRTAGDVADVLGDDGIDMTGHQCGPRVGGQLVPNDDHPPQKPQRRQGRCKRAVPEPRR